MFLRVYIKDSIDFSAQTPGMHRRKKISMKMNLFSKKSPSGNDYHYHWKVTNILTDVIFPPFWLLCWLSFFHALYLKQN